MRIYRFINDTDIVGVDLYYTIVVKENDEEFIDRLVEISKMRDLSDVVLDLSLISDDFKRNCVVEMFAIGAYSYKNNNNLDKVRIITNNSDIATSQHIIDYSNLTKNLLESMRLVETPANLCSSTYLEKYIIDNLPKNVSVNVLEKDDMIRENLNGIIAINDGSKNPAKLIILNYNNTKKGKEAPPIILLGKGVIFDSGGINIKIGQNISNMKTDKAGAIYVYTVIKTLAENNVSGNFIGVLPIVENMVDKNSIRPGDVITTCNGKTVEINNTDAEGRVILADALCYISKHFSNPKLIIDIATLTGQAQAIFGGIGTAVMVNSLGKIYYEKLGEMGDKLGEFFWYLPLNKKFRQFLKSNVADISNYSTKTPAGTILAGMFLSEFIDHSVPWLHLDVAGVVFRERSTGEPLRSIYYFLLDISKA